MSDVEMRLLCLGAALYGVNTQGSKIIAEALEEMERLRKQTPRIHLPRLRESRKQKKRRKS